MSIVEFWKPEYGVVISAENLEAAGIRRLAAQHPEGVRFVEKRFRGHGTQ